VSLYWPCYSDSPLSTYQQQVRGLAKLWWDECPQAAVLVDLSIELQKWYNEVENIIVMTDFNEDIQLAWIKNFFDCFDMQD